MIFLINILLIVFNPISNNQINNNQFEQLNPDFGHIEIVFDSVAETNSENYFSNSEQIINKQNTDELLTLNISENIFTDVYQYSFLYRLLPFLIDVPPPSTHLL